MKKILQLLIIILAQAATAQSPDSIKQFSYKDHFELILKETKKKGSKYAYEAQLKKYNNHEAQTDMEMLSLLIGYTDNDYFEPYTDIFLDKRIYDLNEEKKYDEAIAEGTKILTTKPFLIKILREVAYAYAQKGQKDVAEQYMGKTGKIYNAMFFSSPSTGTEINAAIFALGPKDGQYFIKYFMQADLGTMGSGEDDNGYFIDMLETTFQGMTVVLNFNINHAMKELKEKMEKGTD